MLKITAFGPMSYDFDNNNYYFYYDYYYSNSFFSYKLSY
jgi:hypothetical protein